MMEAAMVGQTKQWFSAAPGAGRFSMPRAPRGRPRYRRLVPLLALLASAIAAPAVQGATLEDDGKARPTEKDCAAPRYPLESRLNGHQGITVLAFLIAPDGAVKASRIATSSGHRELDLAAQRALVLCRFTTDPNKAPDSADQWVPARYVWSLE